VATTSQLPRIAAATRMGAVALTVRDLERSVRFYQDVVGLEPRAETEGTFAMLAGERVLVRLTGDPAAPPRDPRATGLFHLAILLPGRRELAEAIVRLIRARWPLDGASDHLVSEALYLSDPDGNGIEIYRDRPRSDWPHEDGILQMATLPLDLDDVLSELGGALEASPSVPAETVMGHVHLQVSELRQTEAFWSGVIGFDVMVRGYPGALFVSAGGYHHHLGLNTWHSAGHGPPVDGAVGLRWFEIVLPDQAALEAVLARVRDGAIGVEDTGDGWLVRDPSGNAAHLVLGG
jgi:catechol 2,3-dioxygenase